MRKTEVQEKTAIRRIASVLIGSVFALVIGVVVLLIGAAAISWGITKSDSAVQISAAACAAGCLLGGIFACKTWPARRLLAGIAVGGMAFLMTLLIGCVAGGTTGSVGQRMIKLVCCLIGGAAAGLLTRGKRKKTTGRRHR